MSPFTIPRSECACDEDCFIIYGCCDSFLNILVMIVINVTVLNGIVIHLKSNLKGHAHIQPSALVDCAKIYHRYILTSSIATYFQP